MTRAELYEQIQTLPPPLRGRAVAAAIAKYGTPTEDSGGLRRDPAERRAYLGRPADYITEVLGARVITDQQREILGAMERYDRVLFAKGNNLGGTWLLAAYGIYVFDVLGAQLSETREEQGARVILMGPSAPAIEGTIYTQMLLHARNAERLGHRLPGRRSEASVLWTAAPAWEIVALSPPKYVGVEQAHTAAGRHAPFQVVLITEGSGVDESLWKAADGLASSSGNKIISETNPTEATGPFHTRERSGEFKSFHLSTLDHPNVRTRSLVVPGAIDYKVIDSRVEAHCIDRGALSDAAPDAGYGDFVYALPPLGAAEVGARQDGNPGHPAGDLRVYRPGRQFQSQVLGQWPKGVDAGLFPPGAWDAAVERWRAATDPVTAPDRVGVDAAREGDDDTCCAPSWGLDATAALRAFAAATEEVDDATIAALRTNRTRIGAILTMPKGDGPAVAEAAYRAFGMSPWNVDEGGVGASVYDHANRVLGHQVFAVSFGASPLPTVPGEMVCENLRATMYVRAAAMVRLGLVDVPDDPQLREEIMATQPVYDGYKTVEIDGKKIAKPCVRIMEKARIKKKIGRSPDRADAFVLALHSEPIDRYTGNDILTSF